LKILSDNPKYHDEKDKMSEELNGLLQETNKKFGQKEGTNGLHSKKRIV
jgi:hypothetical protein